MSLGMLFDFHVIVSLFLVRIEFEAFEAVAPRARVGGPAIDCDPPYFESPPKTKNLLTLVFR